MNSEAGNYLDSEYTQNEDDIYSQNKDYWTNHNRIEKKIEEEAIFIEEHNEYFSNYSESPGRFGIKNIQNSSNISKNKDSKTQLEPIVGYQDIQTVTFLLIIQFRTF